MSGTLQSCNGFDHKCGEHTLLLGDKDSPFFQEIHLEVNKLIFFNR